MPFPARQESLSAITQRALLDAYMLRTEAATFRSELAAAPVGALRVVFMMDAMRRYRARLLAYVAVSGIVESVRREVNDPALDVATEFNAMIAAVEGVITQIRTDFPKDANGYLLAYQLGATLGDPVVERQFAVAGTANVRARFDTLIAAISPVA